jgi:hypothetical protein
MAIRRDYYDWQDPFFNHIIRIEGQINTATEILRFRLRYADVKTEAERTIRLAQCEYFNMIDQLQNEFLNHNIDLVWGSVNLDHFILNMWKLYFERPGHVPFELRNSPHHWPKLFFFQELQMIFEDERHSITEALVQGWQLYMKRDGYPARFDDDVADFITVWHSVDQVLRDELLQSFEMTTEGIKQWPELQRIDLSYASSIGAEIHGLLLELHLSFPDLRLDISHPRLHKPEDRECASCPICFLQLKEGEVGGIMEHRPVKTVCNHIFGYSCIREWWKSSLTCPMCREDFNFAARHIPTPEEFLQAVDRQLDWIEPEPRISVPSQPHSYIDKLTVIFRPADEVRKRIVSQVYDTKKVATEADVLGRCAAYLARDRLRAVIDQDKELFQTTVQLQAQVFARRAYFGFLFWSHPIRWSNDPLGADSRYR